MFHFLIINESDKNIKCCCGNVKIKPKITFRQFQISNFAASDISFEKKKKVGEVIMEIVIVGVAIFFLIIINPTVCITNIE